MLSLKRLFLIVAGTISVGLGLMGIFLPVLPTTPFLLLAAACYAHSSPEFYRWLVTNKFFGKYISDYQEKKAIPLRVKISALTILWVTILLTAFLVFDMWSIRLLLLLIASAVTLHILLLKTLEE